MERAARTGVITLGGRTDVVPYSYLDDKKQLVGYSIDVADLIAAEASRYLNRPVRIEFVPTNDAARLFTQVSHGEVDMACGSQFTWEREMFVDYTIPYSLSGIRLLSRQGRLSGAPESLAGKRIGVLPGSLGEATIKSVQPRAIRVPVQGVNEGIDALVSGKVDALAGDSVVLAGAIQTVAERGKGFELVPSEGFVRYAVGCILPENNSTFRNVASLAIAKLLQGYVNGNRSATETVNRWLGPTGILELPPTVIKDYFRMVLLNHEQIRVPSDNPTAK
jgi:polar amino acid transport system substrate-binding protein